MLYHDIAQLYAESRPVYPTDIFGSIINKLPPYRRISYLDIGCGTGELLFPLSTFFLQSIGVDLDEDMLHVAAEKKVRKNINNVDLLLCPVEEYLKNIPDTALFDLITAGRSLHWMDQSFVIPKIYDHLRPGGLFAVLGERHGGIWKRKEPWAEAIHKIIFEEFPLKPKFIPIQGRNSSRALITMNMQEVPFSAIYEFEIIKSQTWTIQNIINLYYSGSGFLEWLAEDKSAFEAKVYDALSQLEPKGIFEEQCSFAVTLCVK